MEYKVGDIVHCSFMEHYSVGVITEESYNNQYFIRWFYNGLEWHDVRSGVSCALKLPAITTTRIKDNKLLDILYMEG